jgi:hypothetical protein
MRIGGVDGDLAGQPIDRARRGRDGGPRYRHRDDVGPAAIPAAAAQHGHLVTCLAT